MDTSKAAAALGGRERMDANCANCTSQDFGDCPRCYEATGIGCNHGTLCPDCKAESRAAATLGRKGGRMGTGEAKRRGDAAYYKALRAKVKDKVRRVTIPED